MGAYGSKQAAKMRPLSLSKDLSIKNIAGMSLLF
jgi:hypothetical protein